jgi:hypothetical protein
LNSKKQKKTAPIKTELLNSERSLVGAYIQKPEFVGRIVKANNLTPDSLLDGTCKRGLESCMKLQDAGIPCDPITVMTDSGLNAETIQKLIDDCPTAAHAEYHIGIIRKAYKKRLMARLMSDLQDVDAAYQKVSELLPTVSNSGFTVRSWGEMVEAELPPQKFFLGNLFACGQVQTVFGLGGIGKSRIATNIARNNVLGLPFLNLPTGQPLRHLFVGSENNIHRWQSDTRAMSQGLNQAQRAQLAEHIHGTTLEAPSDCFITLGDDAVKNRWRETIRKHRPDVLWVDPWGDVLMGDGFDRDVRETISTLRTIAGQVNPDCGIAMLAHSRTGASNIAQAVGFDASNFGKDSKALFSCSRAVINLAPYDEAEHPDLVFVNAKNNNAEKIAPMIITLDPVTMTYGFKDWLDSEAWRESVRNSARTSRGGAQSVKFDDNAVLGIAQTVRTVSELHETIKGWGVTKRATDAGIDRLEREGQLKRVKAGTRNKFLIGTPDAVQTYQSKRP